MQEQFVRRLEVESWLDLAKIYSDLEAWNDAEICVEKAKNINIFTPRSWHTKGLNILGTISSCLHNHLKMVDGNFTIFLQKKKKKKMMQV